MKAFKIAICTLLCFLFALCLGGCSRARILEDKPQTAIAFDRSIIRAQGGSETGEQSQAEGIQAKDDSENASDEAKAPATRESEWASQEAEPSHSSVTSPEVTGDAPNDWQEIEQTPSERPAQSSKNEPARQDAPKRSSNDDKGSIDENTNTTPDANTDNAKRDKENVPEEPEQKADPIASQIEAYQRYIGARHQTVYPCQQTNVYAELVEDYVAASRPGSLNKAILSVEAVNLGEDKATPVSDAWVRGMNPGLIVKVVDASVLGSGVNSVDKASEVRTALMGRPDWAGIDAVKSGDVVLVSESLLKDDAGLMVLELYLGMYIYPDAYGDLIEAGGSDFVYRDILGEPPDGIYFYPALQ